MIHYTVVKVNPLCWWHDSTAPFTPTDQPHAVLTILSKLHFVFPLPPSTAHIKELLLSWLSSSRQWADSGEGLCSSDDLRLLQAESCQEAPGAESLRGTSGILKMQFQMWTTQWWFQQLHCKTFLGLTFIVVHVTWFSYFSVCKCVFMLLSKWNCQWSDFLCGDCCCSVLQSKLGALFRPVLHLTHRQEVEPPFCSPKQPFSSHHEPEAKLEVPPTTTMTSINRDTMWVQGLF